MKSIFTALFAICSFVSIAQDSSQLYYPEHKGKCYPVELKHKKNDTVAIPFRNVHIYDVRPDSTKLGYYNADITNTFYKLCTEQNEFSNYYRSFLVSNRKDTSYDVVIFITRGWIFSNSNSSKISLSAEIFIKSEFGFHPLYRYDSVMQWHGTGRFAIEKFKSLLDMSIVKLRSIACQQKLKKALSQDAIETRYHPSRFAVNKPTNKGVYMSLEEFKKDRPTYIDFKVDFNKLTDELFVKQDDGNYSLTTVAWGFYDGKNLFIRVGKNYFLVDQNGSSFNFFATSQLKKEVITHVYIVSPSVISPASIIIDYFVSRKKRKLGKMKPYQLNTLTGEIY